MNQIANDILRCFEMSTTDNEVAKDILMHYGMPRRSGRYPWGSGEDPYQHGSGNFLHRVEELKKKGWEETPENIMKEFGLTTTQYRTEKALAKDEQRCYNVAKAKSMKSDGMGATEIARKMSEELGETINESTVRSWLNSKSEARMNQAKNTADFIREQIESRGMIDVGTGVEIELGVSKEKLKQALKILEEEGYPVYKGGIPQATNKGQQTNQIVICPKGTEHKDIYEFENVHSLTEYVSHDNGETFDKFVYPRSLDSSRVKVLLNDEVGPDGATGGQKDGLIEIRRGVEDLSLGNSRYAQVRILVDGNKYLKGMAVYSDNLPDGVDVLVNSSKSSVEKSYKPIKTDDPDNPFGSLIKAGGQSYYIDKDGKRQLSCINKRADEGDWTEWKDALPSQFLSKQSLNMAKKQLDLAKADKEAEFDEICSLTNPTIKKHLLQKFSDECDSAAVHLQAAALPGQKYHVIIPLNSLKDDEIYAPNYENGTKLALIRYPHEGTFEIPICTVNNKHKAAINMLGKDIVDAVAVNKNVAERLSGADFDGDTVMCIPTHDKSGKVKITSTPPLKGLEGFDDKAEYEERPGMKYMKDPKTGKDSTQMEMGKISNLISDMTLGGASQDELAAATRHAMVVIDAAKHKLDYKQSEIDNNIKGLREKYQRSIDENGNVKIGGASTLISRAKGQTSVLKRQGTPKINIKGEEWYDPSRPEGALIYKTADNVSWDTQVVNKRTGQVTTKTKYKTQKSTKMAETDDPYSLVSEYRHPMELVYADYATSMKKMANTARLEMVSTGKIAYSAQAKKAYASEVKSLNDKLDVALINAPRERESQRRANAEINAKKAAYEKENSGIKMKPGDVKKISQQALTKYRSEVDSVSRKKRSINITDKEWEAIQAGAISENKLTKILANADIKELRQRATPRTSNNLSKAQINRIKKMSNSNYTLAEIANKLGISTSTVSKYLKGEK